MHSGRILLQTPSSSSLTPGKAVPNGGSPNASTGCLLGDVGAYVCCAAATVAWNRQYSGDVGGIKIVETTPRRGRGQGLPRVYYRTIDDGHYCTAKNKPDSILDSRRLYCSQQMAVR